MALLNPTEIERIKEEIYNGCKDKVLYGKPYKFSKAFRMIQKIITERDALKARLSLVEDKPCL